MNILLWVLQVALAWFCIGGGFFQIFKLEQLQTNVVSMQKLPKFFWKLMGIIGCLAGICLIVPGAINMLPILTPIAAVVVGVQSVLITGIYIYHRDFSPMIFTIVMAIIAAFVAYGRLVLNPF